MFRFIKLGSKLNNFLEEVNILSSFVCKGYILFLGLFLFSVLYLLNKVNSSNDLKGIVNNQLKTFEFRINIDDKDSNFKNLEEKLLSLKLEKIILSNTFEDIYNDEEEEKFDSDDDNNMSME